MSLNNWTVLLFICSFYQGNPAVTPVGNYTVQVSSVDEPKATELKSTLVSCCHVPIQMNWVCRNSASAGLMPSISRFRRYKQRSSPSRMRPAPPFRGNTADRRWRSNERWGWTPSRWVVYLLRRARRREARWNFLEEHRKWLWRHLTPSLLNNTCCVLPCRNVRIHDRTVPPTPNEDSILRSNISYDAARYCMREKMLYDNTICVCIHDDVW